jgi:uncharacterized DUF497 family protein
MEVQLTSDQKAFARRAVESGRLHSEEEAVREALALWEDRERRRVEFLAPLDRSRASLAGGEGRVITQARSNPGKHHVSFDDAMLVFEDTFALFEKDRTDRGGEVRWQALGLAGGVILLLVVHTARDEGRDEVIRLISARRATRKERNRYEQTRVQDAS